MKLAESRLLKTKVVYPAAYTTQRKTFAVTDPASQAHVAEVERSTSEDAEAAVHAAHATFQDWKRTPATERAACLLRTSQLLVKHAQDLAHILVAEQGKPLREAVGEVHYGASYFEWFAEQAECIEPANIPWPRAKHHASATRQPVGVCVGITPWNFPLAMVARKVSAALAAGCTIVLKPAEATPLSALALAELLREAGLPDGALCVLPGTREDAKVLGNVLCTHPLIKKLSFTGSSATGKQLAAQCANSVKRLSLELGGNAPFIVFEDAPLQDAVKGALAAKFLNCGQTCIAANRFLIQKDCAAAFTRAVVQAAQSLRQGPGQDKQVQLGPLISESAVKKVNAHVADAVNKGARLLSGGTASPHGSCFVEPTVLTNVTPEMQVFKEETFGPVVAICSFGTEHEALELANSTPFGLACYLYTSDAERGQRLCSELDFGMIGINTTDIAAAAAPFGGVKESGYGREGSRYGLDGYLDYKFQCSKGL